MEAASAAVVNRKIGLIGPDIVEPVEMRVLN
jgi:hypothetical protein